MAARDVSKNINLFVDGRGYAGQLQEFTPPVLSKATEEFRGGGMVGPVKLNMGLEAMDASFSLIAYDRNVLSLFGVVEGQQINCTAREALESFDGQVKAVAHVMRGHITKLDSGTKKPGEAAPLQAELSLSYYRLEHDGVVVQEIDLLNMIHVMNGVDILADQRAALGL